MIDVDALFRFLVLVLAWAFGIVNVGVGVWAAREGVRPGGLYPATMIVAGAIVLGLLVTA